MPEDVVWWPEQHEDSQDDPDNRDQDAGDNPPTAHSSITHSGQENKEDGISG